MVAFWISSCRLGRKQKTSLELVGLQYATSWDLRRETCCVVDRTEEGLKIYSFEMENSDSTPQLLMGFALDSLSRHCFLGLAT